MIEIKNLHKNFGNVNVLNGINLNIKKGEVVAIIGPSGTGKSTLLRCINFLENPSIGTITIDNLCVDSQNYNIDEIYALRKKTAMIFQNHSLFKNKTVLENLTLPLTTVHKMNKEKAEQVAIDILSKIGLLDKRDCYPSVLSGGQQQRVGIGRAMAADAKIMLFDEPTSALDPSLVGEVLELIKDLAKKQTTMLIVTHEMTFAKNFADRIIFMNHGVIIEDNTPEVIFNCPEEEETKQFLYQILKNRG